MTSQQRLTQQFDQKKLDDLKKQVPEVLNLRQFANTF